MSDHASFLAAIKANPADNLPRLVYADYLEENGHLLMASMIRGDSGVKDHLWDDIGHPDEVASHVVYAFEWIDTPGMMLDARYALSSYSYGGEYLAAIKTRLRQGGWDGDGLIQAMWIPPFVFDNPDTYGVLIWHVKQQSRGRSYIASPYPLPFPALIGPL